MSFTVSPISRAMGRRQSGQGMTEYLIVVALIAVAAIGVFSLFGQTLRNQTAGLAMEISGQSSSSAVSAARDSSTSERPEGLMSDSATAGDTCATGMRT